MGVYDHECLLSCRLSCLRSTQKPFLQLVQDNRPRNKAVGDREVNPCAKLRVDFNLVKVSQVSKRIASPVILCRAQWANGVTSSPLPAPSGHSLMIHGFLIRTWKMTSASTWTFCHPRWKITQWGDNSAYLWSLPLKSNGRPRLGEETAKNWREISVLVQGTFP